MYFQAQQLQHIQESVRQQITSFLSKTLLNAFIFCFIINLFDINKFHHLKNFLSSLNSQNMVVIIKIIMQKLQAYHCQLLRIFVYYCSFGDKENVTLLKNQNYQRLLSDLQIPLDQQGMRSKCDVLFYSIENTNGALTIQNFKRLLQPLCSLVLESKSIEEFLKFYIQPLHDHLMEETDFGPAISLISPRLLRENCYVFLKRFAQAIRSIYQFYFPLSGNNKETQQMKYYFKLCKELQFMPSIVSKPIAYVMFNFLKGRQSTLSYQLQSPKKSKYAFTLECFFDLIVIISHIRCRKDIEDHLKIYELLQNVQVSKGYQKLSKIIKIPHFFVPEEELQIIKTKESISYQQRSYSRIRQPIVIVEAPLRKKLGEYYDILKSKYVLLCSKKQVQSNFYLKENVLKTILTKICPTLPGARLDNLVSYGGKLTFDNFIQIINSAATLLKIDPEKLYDQIIVYSENGSSIALVSQNIVLPEKQHANCLQILRLARSYLKSIYDFYQFSSSLSLTGFLRFLEQTCIIPRILSSIEASNIYQFCSKQNIMDFQQFQHSLLRIISSIYYENELEGVERLLFVLELICNSKRGQALMKKNKLLVKQHPLYKVRLIFADAYQRIKTKTSSKGMYHN